MRSFAHVEHPHLRQRPVLLSAVASHSGQARHVDSRVARASGGVAAKPERAKRCAAEPKRASIWARRSAMCGGSGIRLRFFASSYSAVAENFVTSRRYSYRRIIIKRLRRSITAHVIRVVTRTLIFGWNGCRSHPLRVAEVALPKNNQTKSFRCFCLKVPTRVIVVVVCPFCYSKGVSKPISSLNAPSSSRRGALAPTTRAIHSASCAVFDFDFYCAGGCEAEGHRRKG